jgi:hypothetical protein
LQSWPKAPATTQRAPPAGEAHDATPSLTAADVPFGVGSVGHDRGIRCGHSALLHLRMDGCGVESAVNHEVDHQQFEELGVGYRSTDSRIVSNGIAVGRRGANYLMLSVYVRFTVRRFGAGSRR